MIVGFVGLGNMGSALAANLSDAGFELVTYDAAGRGSTAKGVTDVARQAEIVVLSLPDGNASESVARELIDTNVTHVVDTSTIGVRAARDIDALLADHGIAYVDAPVSGGVEGARARTLAVMYAASDDACAHVEHVLAGLSDRRFRVGDRAGLAQAMKLANNFLSATVLAATSEAIAFGQSVGLDMATMLEVLNASSGRNSATADKFPNHVLTGTYASGFANTLMAKDMRLYLDEAGPGRVAALTAAIWTDFAATQPGADFTRIYTHVTESHD